MASRPLVVSAVSAAFLALAAPGASAGFLTDTEACYGDDCRYGKMGGGKIGGDDYQRPPRGEGMRQPRGGGGDGIRIPGGTGIGIGIGGIGIGVPLGGYRPPRVYEDDEPPPRRRPPRIIVEEDDVPPPRVRRPPRVVVEEPPPRTVRERPPRERVEKPPRERTREAARPPKPPAPPAAARAVPPPPPLVAGLPPAGETRFVPDEVLVEFSGRASGNDIDGIVRRERLRLLSSTRIDLVGATLNRYRIEDQRSVPDVIRALAGDARVAAAQPNYLYDLQQAAPQPAHLHVLQQGATPAVAAPVAPQPSSGPQYALDKMNLFAALQRASGRGVAVAVIDSGIDERHPELAGAVERRFDAVGDGLTTGEEHGTGIAAIISARATLKGIAPGARLFAVRAFGSAETSGRRGGGTTHAIVTGIDWAVGQGARVLNMSFAGPADPLMSRGLAAAARSGVVAVAAAGNGGPTAAPAFPAADPNVIAVTATDGRDTIYEHANQGAYVAVAAPGVDIVTASPAGSYQVVSGTSQAAAHVSGVVALLLEAGLAPNPAAVRARIAGTAHDLGQPGPDPVFGAGLVDAGGSLAAAATAFVPDPAPANRP